MPIPAFCSSDEEEEDKSALLYLPIAPEIEDPEDNWVPGVDPTPTHSDDSPHKRNYDAAKENASPKKKKPKTLDIELENAPLDGNLLYFFFRSLSKRYQSLVHIEQIQGLNSCGFFHESLKLMVQQNICHKFSLLLKW